MLRALDSTFYVMFTTKAFSTNAPTTLAGTPVVSAYEDNSVTQITAGITLGVDHDSVTGLNLLTIVATTANGYEAGKDYNLVITTGTVDSVSVVGEIVGSFYAGTIATLDALDTAQDAQHLITQDAVGQIAVGSGGVAVVATGFAKDGAEPETNAYTDTATAGTLHIVEDDGGATGFHYEFNVGTDGVPMNVDWTGYAQSNGDDYTISFYNWGTTTFDPVDTIAASNGTTQISRTFIPTIAHVGTGANVGLVRLRFSSADGTSLATNRVICTYTSVVGGIANGSTITLASDTVNENFIGKAWNLALGGQLISGSYFNGADSVTGTATITNGSVAHFDDCRFGAVTISADTHFDFCKFGDTLTFTSTGGVTADDMDIISGNSVVAGTGSPAFDLSAVTKETNINCRKWSGGSQWTLTSDCTLSLEVQEGGGQTITTGGGTVEVRGFCRAITITSSGTGTTQIIATCGPITINGTGGTVNIYGTHGSLTDNSGGSVTINDQHNALDGADIRASVGLSTANLDAQFTSILTDTASMGVTKNAVFSNFEFPMRLSSDHYSAGTGLTVTGEMSIDGAAFTAINGAIAEVGSGVYQVDFTADDTNGDVITYKFSEATCDDTITTIKTRA